MAIVLSMDGIMGDKNTDLCLAINKINMLAINPVVSFNQEISTRHINNSAINENSRKIEIPTLLLKRKKNRSYLYVFQN